MPKHPPFRIAELILVLIGLLLNVVLAAGACSAHEAFDSYQQSASPTCALSGSADVRRLEAGTIIERELAGGPTHFYEINVSAGQFLRVIVDQKGVDVE